jgi:hypothetical protein
MTLDATLDHMSPQQAADIVRIEVTFSPGNKRTQRCWRE